MTEPAIQPVQTPSVSYEWPTFSLGQQVKAILSVSPLATRVAALPDGKQQIIGRLANYPRIFAIGWALLSLAVAWTLILSTPLAVRRQGGPEMPPAMFFLIATACYGAFEALNIARGSWWQRLFRDEPLLDGRVNKLSVVFQACLVGLLRFAIGGALGALIIYAMSQGKK